MDVTDLPEDYLLYLKGIHDGTETDYTQEDEQMVEALTERLNTLELEEE